MSDEIELWRWEYYDDVRKRRFRTKHLLTEADARAQLPKDAVKLEWSREVRRAVGCTSDLQKRFSPASSGGATGRS